MRMELVVCGLEGCFIDINGAIDGTQTENHQKKNNASLNFPEGQTDATVRFFRTVLLQRI